MDATLAVATDSALGGNVLSLRRLIAGRFATKAL
jgi:hypothetical protein